MKKVVRKIRAFNNNSVSSPPTETAAVKAATDWLDTYSKSKPPTLDQQLPGVQRGPPLSVGIPRNDARGVTDKRPSPPKKAPRRPGLVVQFAERLSYIPRGENYPEYDSDDGLWLPPSPSSRPLDLSDEGDDLDDGILEDFVQASSSRPQDGPLHTPSQNQASSRAQAHALPPSLQAHAPLRPPPSMNSTQSPQPPAPPPAAQQQPKPFVQAPPGTQRPPPPPQTRMMQRLPQLPTEDQPIPARRARPVKEGSRGSVGGRRSVTAQELLSMAAKEDEDDELPAEILQFLQPTRPAPRPSPSYQPQPQPSQAQSSARPPPTQSVSHLWHGSKEDKGEPEKVKALSKYREMPEHPMNALTAHGLGVEGGGGPGHSPGLAAPFETAPPPPDDRSKSSTARPPAISSTPSGSSRPTPRRLDTSSEMLSQRAPPLPDMRSLRGQSQSVDAGNYTRRQQQRAPPSSMRLPGSDPSGAHSRSISESRTKPRPTGVLLSAPLSNIPVSPAGSAASPLSAAAHSPSAARAAALLAPPLSTSANSNSTNKNGQMTRSLMREPLPPPPPTPPSASSGTFGGNAYVSVPARPPPSPSELAYLYEGSDRESSSHGHGHAPRNVHEASDHALLSAVFPSPSKTRKEEQFTFGSSPTKSPIG